MSQALWITHPSDHRVTTLTQRRQPTSREHPIQVRVHYSSLNYKDALAISGSAPVVRHFPLTPGIDAIGEITDSQESQWPCGQLVIVTGWGIGEQYHGGLADYICVNPHWLIRLPEGITAQQAAIIGTAGLTAMLAVLKLEKQGITPELGPVLVTGATGGVGSFSTWILAQRGYQVTAVTGDPLAEQYLTTTLGAAQILPRSALDQPGKKLASERWAAAIDCVGGDTLANILASTQRDGCVVACGMAQGLALTTSVAPFILRGIQLLGVDSVYCSTPLRQQAWQRFSQLLADQPIAITHQTIYLDQVIHYAEQLLAGKIQGRVVVQCRKD